MFVYWFACFSSMALTWFCSKIKKTQKITPIVAFVSIFPLFLLSALRLNVGTDYISYQIAFTRILGGDNQRIEPLYVFLNKLVQFLGGEYQSLIVITSLIVCLLFMIFILHESCDVTFSVFLFVGTLQYFASLTNIRQCIGIAFAMCSLIFLQKNKNLFFFFFVGIGACFHYSILLFLVVFFANKIPANRRLMVILLILLFLLRGLIVSLIEQVASFTKYQTYFGSKWDDGQVSYAILSIQISIFIFSTIFYCDDAKYELYYKIQFLTVAISFFLGILPLIFRIERIFAAANIVLIPLSMKRVNPRLRVLFYALLIGLFMVYSYISVFLHNQFLAIPYQSIL